jgi:ancient ubiquitous protein 1
VLPYVPGEVVRKDLLRTKSVDVTISNILEGHISYVPLLPSSTAPEPSPSVSPRDCVPEVERSSLEVQASSGSDKSLNTAASSFPKSANDRALSFKERKMRLIENARRRYIDKHGLKELGFSAS